MDIKKYNTFVVYDCRNRKNMLVTSSAIKANGLMTPGVRIEVWNRNELIEKIYAIGRGKNPMKLYIDAERRFIAEKQARHEERNRRRPNGKRTEFETRGV